MTTRLTDKQRRVLAYIAARRGQRVDTGTIAMRALTDEWGFGPRNVMAGLERRGLLRAEYVAFVRLTYWALTDTGRAALAERAAAGHAGWREDPEIPRFGAGDFDA
jgi:hypothetical protein